MSLLKELEELNVNAAAIPDIEDVNFDNKIKKKTRRHLDDSDEEEEEPVERRRIHGAVDLNDERYKGESVSRADLFGDSSEMTTMSARGKKGRNRNNSIGSEELKFDGDDEEMESDEDDEDEEEEEEETSGDEEKSEVGGDKEGDDDDLEEENEGGPKVKVADVLKPIQKDDEKKKGESVRKQLALCEQVLLMNIKLHGAMREFNQLPRGRAAKATHAAADDATKANIIEARKNMRQILDVLLGAEEAILGGSVQTKGLIQSEKKNEGADGELDSDDEEIESSDDEKEEGGKGNNGLKKRDKIMEDQEEFEDDDGIPDYNVEGSDDSDDEDDKMQGAKANIGGLSSIEKRIVASEIRFEKFRNNTISKWDQRTRLVSVGKKKDARKDFSAFDGGDALAQIDKILSDRKRLVIRTQVKRSDHERIGGDSEATHDAEIFDDDDFYQQLLRDLIERKTDAETMDPIAMSRQWLELEKLRQKRSKKKNVDRRASKGRKIRYTVIPKLVNFHAAAPECVEWSHEMRNELFRSLFR